MLLQITIISIITFILGYITGILVKKFKKSNSNRDKIHGIKRKPAGEGKFFIEFPKPSLVNKFSFNSFMRVKGDEFDPNIQENLLFNKKDADKVMRLLNIAENPREFMVIDYNFYKRMERKLNINPSKN